MQLYLGILFGICSAFYDNKKRFKNHNLRFVFRLIVTFLIGFINSNTFENYLINIALFGSGFYLVFDYVLNILEQRKWNTLSNKRVFNSKTVYVDAGSGRIVTKYTGMPCITLNNAYNVQTPTNGNFNSNGTILLKDLIMINDGTVAPIAINPLDAQVQEVSIMNVKSNSLIVDANITEVGESIVRNTNYK